MRMWMVSPSILCRQHLLGEHKEIHMLLGCMKRGKSIKGYIDQKIVSPHKIWSRHQILVMEMQKRGYNHKSPIGFIEAFQAYKSYPRAQVDIEKSKRDLHYRCEECRKNIIEEVLV